MADTAGDTGPEREAEGAHGYDGADGAGPEREPDRAYAAEVVARLRAAFEADADREWAVGAAAYLRDQFPFLGVRTPVRRRLARQALADLRPASQPELAATALLLWDQPEREFQYAGADLLRAHAARLDATFLDVARHLITTKSWWDTVDPLAAHTVGPLVRRHPELAVVLEQWIDGDELWLARAALLHQLTYGPHTDPVRLFDHCRRRAADPEPFIRKAVGWALRQYAAIDPDAVERFVQATAELSPLSVREATRGVDRARARRPA